MSTPVTNPATPNEQPNPAAAHLRVPGIYTSGSSRSGSDPALHVVKNAAQREKVQQSVTEKGFLPKELVKYEVEWFYDSLGIEENYFANESVDVITDHIIALFAAKTLAYTKHSNQLVIELEKITENGALFIHTSAPGVTSNEGPGATCERRIDDMFLDVSTPEKAFRLETYRSAGVTSAANSQSLRCYFVSQCVFPEYKPPSPTQDPSKRAKTDIRTVSDKVFLEKASDNTLEIYQQVMWNVEERFGPVIEFYEVEGTRERRVVIGYKMGTTAHFFSALSELYHFYSLYSARKYVEQFANGVTIISLYLNPLPGTNAPPIEHSIFQVTKEASLLYCLPDNPFFRTEVGVTPTSHAVQEATYAYAGWIFAQHFCNRLGPAYSALKGVLDEANPGHAEVLTQINKRFREETFTRQ
ncbi:13588_t:CDS:2, partial [Acaulospora colombiana]